jgi:hypothetical protein
LKTTRRFAALALASALFLGACTGGEEDPNGEDLTGATGSQDTGPTPAQTFTPGVGVFTYENAGLKVTVNIEGTSGTVEVDNGTDHDLEQLDLYVLDAVDGHEIQVEVRGSTPVAAGDPATFEISLGETEVDQIGLLVLLFGKDNYGAFVRTG